jgi:integrase
MKHRPYSGGIIRERDDGRVQADYARAGKRKRRLFATDGEARAWLETVHLDRSAGIAAPTIPDIIDARDARALLPEGVTLRDAARFWSEHHAASPHASEPIAAHVARFLADKSAAGLRARTMTKLRSTLNRLARAFPHVPPANIATRHLQEWLQSMGGVPQTRDGWRRDLVNFFGWLERGGSVVGNPAKGISVGRWDSTGAIVVWNRVQVDAILAAACRKRPDMLAFLAIAFWAGLRTGEIERLEWANIGPDYLRVTAAASKRRQHRLVPMQPVLLDILATAKRTSATYVAPAQTRACIIARKTVYAAARKAAPELFPTPSWPDNVARHSYITHRLAIVQSLEQVRLEAGNSGNIILDHYRALVTATDAAAYFVPPKDTPNVPARAKPPTKPTPIRT